MGGGGQREFGTGEQLTVEAEVDGWEATGSGSLCIAKLDVTCLLWIFDLVICSGFAGGLSAGGAAGWAAELGTSNEKSKVDPVKPGR